MTNCWIERVRTPGLRYSRLFEDWDEGTEENLTCTGQLKYNFSFNNKQQIDNTNQEERKGGNTDIEMKEKAKQKVLEELKKELAELNKVNQPQWEMLEKNMAKAKERNNNEEISKARKEMNEHEKLYRK